MDATWFPVVLKFAKYLAMTSFTTILANKWWAKKENENKFDYEKPKPPLLIRFGLYHQPHNR